MDNLYNIKQINEDTYVIEEEGVRFFLLLGNNQALMIDSGMKVHHALDIAKTLTTLPVQLLNTHADMDHCGSNHQFSEVYLHLAECANYFKGKSANIDILPLENGMILDLGNRPLEIIALPGHTPGSIGVLDQKYGYFYSGDPIQDGAIFMFGPFRNMQAYHLSLKQLEKRLSDIKAIFPSHGTCPLPTTIVPQLITASKNILEGNYEGEVIQMFGNEVLKVNMGCANFLLGVK